MPSTRRSLPYGHSRLSRAPRKVSDNISELLHSKLSVLLSITEEAVFAIILYLVIIHADGDLRRTIKESVT